MINELTLALLQNHGLPLPHPGAVIPIEVLAPLHEVLDRPDYRLKSAQKIKARYRTKAVIQQMIPVRMTRRTRRERKPPRATVMKRKEKEKTKVARGALEHKHRAPRQRIRSLRPALQHAGPVGDDSMTAAANVHLNFDTEGV
jgi:hypothetical protein